jgi:hypothetical protein
MNLGSPQDANMKDESYNCCICKKSFLQLCNLKVHVEKFHHRQTFQCYICMQQLSSIVNLTHHIKKTHAEVYALYCDECKTWMRGDMARHLKSKTHRKAIAQRQAGLPVFKKTRKLKWPSNQKATKESEMETLIKEHAIFMTKAKEEIAQATQTTKQTIVKTNEAISNTNSILEALALVNQAIATASALTDSARTLNLADT